MRPGDWGPGKIILVIWVASIVLALIANEATDIWTWLHTEYVATWALVLVTAGLIVMAWWQLSDQTLQHRRWATLQACDRYDIDLRLGSSLLLLRRLAAEDCSAIPHYRVKMMITNVFNYFDAIAIGLERGFYVEEIVREHLGAIMQYRREELMASKHPAIQEFRQNFERDYTTFNRLMARWYPQQGATAHARPAA
ncbi:MAG TPA: hypothetical protein VEU47_11405 [Candidatus Cybelea sp.]|nr:hypothetical protein [Candidatus Cybelea sp.]